MVELNTCPMLGTIVKINSAKGLLALKTSEGYSVLEIISDGKIDIGDLLSFADDLPIGESNLINKTKKLEHQVRFQAHRLSPELAHGHLFL
jgi:hypothetical protein